jgi:hypothetical protein
MKVRIRSVQWAALVVLTTCSLASVPVISAQSANGDSLPSAAASDAVPGTPVPASSASTPASAAPEQFTHVIKYLGGAGFPDFKGKETWDNDMTITADSVIAVFADTSLAPRSVPLAGVTKVIYGQAASRHVGRWVAIGVLVAPVALFGLFHKSRHHFVALSWNDENGQERGVYVEVNKDHFRRLLNTVSYRTGKPIYADPKEQKWLLTQGVMAQVDPSAATEK